MQNIQKLEIRQISRVFGANAALHEFTLDIEGGMFVSLLGPSGCGKSTALNCIAGLLELSAGEILLNGQPIHHLPPEKRGFGMVFQNYALFPHMTVTRNVQYGLETLHMPKSEQDRRVRWALELVQLDEAEFGRRYPAQLSGGQQQRLALARTIVLEPGLLLLDEPLSNLDAKLRGEMRLEIKRMHQQLELTTIYVTHDQSEAMSLSDLVVVMRKGRIEQIGTSQEIYNCPRSLYVADFMGYSNRLPVTIQNRAGDEWQVQTDAGIALRATSTFGGSADWQIGQKVLACSRPDDLTPDQPLNRIGGIVHLVEYIGKAFETVIRLTNDESVQLIMQSAEAPVPGHDISAGIASGRLLLFPFDPAFAGRAQPHDSILKEARHA